MKKYQANIFWITVLTVALALSGCIAPAQKVHYPQTRQAQPIVTQAKETPTPAPTKDDQKKGPESFIPTVVLQPEPPSGRSPELQAKLRDMKQDLAYVERRLATYEKKFQQWLELEDTETISEQNYFTPMAWDGCMGRLERLLNGYTQLRDSMLQEPSVQDKSEQKIRAHKILLMDIAFLESDCEKQLVFDSSSTATDQIGNADRTITKEQAEFLINQHFKEEEYEEVISVYQLMSSTYPDRETSLLTTIQYSSALLHTGQTDAAADVFQKAEGRLSTISQTIEPWSLQRRIADLLLTTGNLAGAKSQYEKLISLYDEFNDENSWAMMQLGILDEFETTDGQLADYIDLLRAYLIFDSKKHNPMELLDNADELAQTVSNNLLAEGALEIKLAIEHQLQSRTYNQLNLVDELVAEKNFQQAITLLNELSPHNLPAELRDIIQEKLDDVLQAEADELESQRVLFEETLDNQWETAVNLLDSEQYDAAIAGFESLLDTDYDSKARQKMAAAAILAATAKRKEAATLFIRAVKTGDTELKKELLLHSRNLLKEILTKYPQVDLIDKVTQNLEAVEEHIRQFDPQLLEESEDDIDAGRFGRGTH